MLPNFSYVRVNSAEEAIKHLSSGEARLHAGGTDLLGCLRDGVFGADKLVSISGLKELQGIKLKSDGGLRIGAMTTLAEIAKNEEINEQYAGLAQAAAEVASPQLRNQGTIGGNICQKPRCWYYRGDFHCLRKGGKICYAIGGEDQYHCIFGGHRCFMVHPSDTAAALLALEATVHIVGPLGKRSVLIDDFFILPGKIVQQETVLEPGEIVTGVSLPPAKAGSVSRYRKVRARRSWDFALAGLAASLVFDGRHVVDARLVLSGAAPVPWRSWEAEKAIIGSRLDQKSVERAAQAAVGKARPMTHNGYKITLFQGLIVEELQAIGKIGSAS